MRSSRGSSRGSSRRSSRRSSKLTIGVAFCISLLACKTASTQVLSTEAKPTLAELDAGLSTGRFAEAFLAGGCFWCMEADFEKTTGVVEVISGYQGGPETAPTYEQVSSGQTGHVEAVRILYDPKIISYARLLEVFWTHIDPTQDDGQFCDRGPHYRSAIFTRNENERETALAGKRLVDQGGQLPGPVVTKIAHAGPFYPAEAHHQDFHVLHAEHYLGYRVGCGRDQRLKTLWGPPPIHGGGRP